MMKIPKAEIKIERIDEITPDMNITYSQNAYLENVFSKSKFPSMDEVDDISVDVGMDRLQVEVILLVFVCFCSYSQSAQLC